MQSTCRAAVIVALACTVGLGAATAGWAAPTIARLAGTNGCLFERGSFDAAPVPPGLGACATAAPAVEGQALQVVVAPDGLDVLVRSERIGSLRRDPRTGALSPAQCVDGAPRPSPACLAPAVLRAGSLPGEVPEFGYEPEGMFLSATGRDLAVQWDDPDLFAPGVVTLFRRDPASGRLSEAGCLTAAGGAAGCVGLPILRDFGSRHDVITAAAFSADGTLAVLETGSGVATFARDPATLALTFRACAMWARRIAPCNAMPSAGGGAVLTADARRLLLLQSEDGLGRDAGRIVDVAVGHDGDLTAVGCYEERAAGACRALPGVAGARSFAFAPDGRMLYLLATPDDIHPLGETRLSWWRLSPEGGLIRGGCASDQFPHVCRRRLGHEAYGDLSFTADGRELLVGGLGPFGRYGYVALLTRDPVTGSVRQSGCVTTVPRDDCAVVGGVWHGLSASLTPDARNVYIAPFQYGGVIALGRSTAIDPTAAWRRRGARAELGLTCPGVRSEGCAGRLTVRARTGRLLAARNYRLAGGTRATVAVRLASRPASEIDVAATDSARIVNAVRQRVRLSR